MARLLVLEDEGVLARLVRSSLERAGHAVDVVESIAGAIHAIQAAAYELLILDRRVPDGDGVQILNHVRENRLTVPMMCLTARSALDERVAALNGGADDYLCKPFEVTELVARVGVFLRRPRTVTSSTMVAGNIILDRARHAATVAGMPLAIARRETMLLEQLVLRSGQVRHA